jgi:uncharacterized protein involved in outer membrane biogenesis
MKKLLKLIGGLLAILIIVVVCVILFWLGPTVKKAAETIGPQATGAPLTIEKLHIFPLRGIVQLKGLVVANPPGFKNANAVTLKQLTVDISIASLLTDTIVIREILIDSPEFTYERKMKTDNIAAIRENVQAFKDKKAGAPTEQPPIEQKPAPEEPPKEEKAPSEKPAKKVVIEKLRVIDGVVRAKVPGLPTTPIPLPDIEKNDIGKEQGGTSWAKATTEIGSTLYDAIIHAVSNVGGMATDALKGAGGATVDAASSAAKSFGGLFKKKEEQ